MTRTLALFLTVLTGFSGLAYEVAWEKYLAMLLGSHSEATAAVLGIFLGGLSLGYSLFGRVTRRLVKRADAAGRPPRLLLTYGGIEAAIGLYVIAFPWLFRAVQSLSFRLPHGAGGLGFVVDVGLATILIGPPTVLMGATIPILTQALARSLDDATRFHAFVYAFNTAGAFVGALAAGFFLIPQLGLARLMFAMGSINLTVGSVFMLVGLRSRGVIALSATAGVSSGAGFALYAGVALLIGFSMMAVQTTLIRIGGLALGASQFTFSMVVAVFVLCIALGSFGVSVLPNIRRAYLPATVWGLAALLYLLYEPLQDAPYWAHVLRTLFRDQNEVFYPYHFAAFLGLAAVIGVPVLLSGASLPLIFHQLRREVEELGVNAGRLYSWNTAGSLLGALLGGYALLFWLDLHQVYRIAVGSVALAAVLLTTRARGLSRPTAAFLFSMVVAALVLLEPWDGKRLSAGVFRNRTPQPVTYAGPQRFFAALEQNFELLFYDDGPTASTAVKQYALDEGSRFSRSIVSNGKSDGNTESDYPTMGLAALLPALFAERAERAFVIGYGTGVTAGELAALEPMREVVVAEISTGVVRAAPLFDFVNMNASTNPRMHILRSDAYRALLRSDGRYDLIVSEPSNPWVLGVEMLFSREFLAAARSRLTPRGVFCQWIHEYETDNETLALVLRTYASVFDDVAVWYAGRTDLLLLGFNDASLALDLDRLEVRAGRFGAGLRRSGIESFPQLLAHEILPLGVLRAAALEGPLHTLDHPRLNHQAGRAFFRGSTGSLPFTGQRNAARVGERNSLLRRYSARYGGELPEDLRAVIVKEVCSQRVIQCAPLLAEWSDREGSTPASRRVLAKARREHPEAQVLEPSALLQLKGLLGAPSGTDASIPLDLVQRADRLFRFFYLHAQPFDPNQLIRLWERCEAPPGRPGACRSGLRQFRAVLAGRAQAEREDPAF